MPHFKEFIKRNKPIFVVGGLILSIFLGIILVSLEKTTNETKLSKVDEEQVYIKDVESTAKNPDDITTLEELDIYIEENAEEIYDDYLGLALVEFTSNGFQPKNSRVIQGQILRFVNKTDKDIYIKQRTKGYDVFANPVAIEAGKAYDLRLTKAVLWGFEETQSKSVGSVYIFTPEF